MTPTAFWMVVWVAWVCPKPPVGLGWLLPDVPAVVRPLVCRQEPRVAAVETREDAAEALRKAGSAARPSAHWCQAARGRGVRCWDRAVAWREELVGP